jgi:hypothetical protein
MANAIYLSRVWEGWVGLGWVRVSSKRVSLPGLLAVSVFAVGGKQDPKMLV